MNEENNPKKSGRKEAPIDMRRVDELLECRCTGTEIAAYFGVHPDTLYDRIVKESDCSSFSEYMHKKRSSGDAKLREAQIKNAMAGNTTMQIWLGKNNLGQKDSQEVEIKSNLSDFDQWKGSQEKKA